MMSGELYNYTHLGNTYDVLGRLIIAILDYILIKANEQLSPTSAKQTYMGLCIKQNIPLVDNTWIFDVAPQLCKKLLSLLIFLYNFI